MECPAVQPPGLSLSNPQWRRESVTNEAFPGGLISPELRIGRWFYPESLKIPASGKAGPPFDL